MNIPTYQKKDYSYLPTAFNQLSQGLGKMQQGISTAIDIGEKERKRQQEDEFLAKLKVTRADTETVYDKAVAEAAVKIREAKGLPDNEEGYNQALSEALRIFYPITADEWKNGTGVLRLHKQEQDELPKYLDKARMDNWTEKYLKGTETKPYQRAEIQEPIGEVGVEEEGTVKKPLAAGPQTLQEAQQSAGKEMLEQPPVQLTRQLTPDDLWRLGVELGVTENPKFKQMMEEYGRTTIMGQEGEPMTAQKYTAEGYRMPVVPTGTTKLPEEVSELDRLKLEQKRISDLRKADNQDQVDKNINKAKDQLYNIRQKSIANGITINKLRQARSKITSGKSLGNLSAILKDIATDPNNPSLYEIDSEIDRLQLENEASKEMMDELKGIISDLSKGVSLPKATLNIEKAKEDALTAAKNYIATDIVPISSQITTSAQILSRLPAAHKKVITEKIQWLRDRGVLDKDIVNFLLGRK